MQKSIKLTLYFGSRIFSEAHVSKVPRGASLGGGRAFTILGLVSVLKSIKKKMCPWKGLWDPGLFFSLLSGHEVSGCAPTYTLSLHGPKVNEARGYQTEASTTGSCNTHGYLRYFVKVMMKNYHTSGKRYARHPLSHKCWVSKFIQGFGAGTWTRKHGYTTQLYNWYCQQRETHQLSRVA